ncbi:MFS transporter [Kitasatospora sp. NPDC093550]|uniref:MFS transporter n=1 Tax=Kitasatospora sp. NPDC093550 TaxID=3364089 RepID=UPI003806980E
MELQRRSARILQVVLPWSRTVWVLALSTVARSIGHGTVVTVSVLYFTRSVDIPAARVGLGLTVAAVAGMVASVPAGRLADVIGARTASIWYVVLQGVALWSYPLVGGLTSLLVATGLVAVAESGSAAARGALVAGVVPGPDRVRTRAYLRSATNVGFSVGTLVGGAALGSDTPAGYTAELLGAGAMFVLAGLILLALTAPPAAPRAARGARWPVLRDRPYAAIGLLNAVLITNTGILNVALPIWIAERTQAPTSVFAGLLLVNTVLVVFCQIPVSRGAEDVRGGARAMRRSGLWLAACCVLFTLGSGPSPVAAVAVLAVGVVAHTIGELLYSAGSWALSYELAPEHAHGQYQGLFGLTSQLGTAVTPAVTTFMIIDHGWFGWGVLAVLLAAAGLATPAVARWAERTRPAAAPALEPEPA